MGALPEANTTALPNNADRGEPDAAGTYEGVHFVKVAWKRHQQLVVFPRLSGKSGRGHPASFGLLSDFGRYRKRVEVDVERHL